MGSEQARDKIMKQEEAVLKQYAMRWAVLTAWRDALKQRGVKVPSAVDTTTEAARTKIASGCFSVCEVGNDLSSIEGELTMADGSSKEDTVESWLDLLAKSMAENSPVEQLLQIPTIKARYSNCGASVCRC